MPHLVSRPSHTHRAVRRVTPLLLITLALALTGCRNPLYLVAQAARMWVSVPSERRIYELDREGLRSTHGQVWLEASATRLAWSPVMRQVVAIQPESRSVALVDAGLLRVSRNVGVGGTPVDVAISTSGMTAHVLLAEERAVALVDLRSGKVQRVALSPSGAKPAVLACPRQAQDESWIVAEDGRIEIVREGALQPAGTPLSGSVKPFRAVTDAAGGIVLLDTGRAALVRLPSARGDSATLVSIGTVTGGGQPADMAVAPDGKAAVTFPDAGRVVILEADGRSQSYASGAPGARAVVADARGFHVAHEGPNQVFALTWSGSTLLAARWVDTLPGPPVAAVALD